MDDATKKAMNDFVMSMIEGAKSTANFAIEQTPALVQEWLNWQLTESIVYIVVSLGVLITAWIIRNKVVELVKSRTKDEEDILFTKIIGSVTAGVVTLFLVIGPLMSYTMYAAKILVAPRVVIIEKFIQILK